MEKSWAVTFSPVSLAKTIAPFLPGKAAVDAPAVESTRTHAPATPTARARVTVEPAMARTYAALVTKRSAPRNGVRHGTAPRRRVRCAVTSGQTEVSVGPIASWLMDMDGVLVREEHPIPGADQFLARLRERG